MSTSSEPSAVARALRSVNDGCRDLGRERVAEACAEILAGTGDETQIADLLVGLQERGETTSELLGAIAAVRARQLTLPADDRAVDVGGSGGDGASTFNVSTTAAVVAAAAGARVVKHGGGASTGLCGSADLARQLGLPMAEDERAVAAHLSSHGFAFLPSSAFLRYPEAVVRLRRHLGVRTLFNLIGPWCNPAGVGRRVVGLADPRLLERYAEVGQVLGVRRVFIVHGRDGGLDEFSPSGVSTVAEVRDGTYQIFDLRLEDLGLPTGPPESVRGGDAATNAAITKEILGGIDRGPRRSLTLATAAAALYVADSVGTLADGVALAALTIDDGRAMAFLLRLQTSVSSMAV